MNIKNRLRMALLEAKHKNHKNDYGCVMVYLNVNQDKWDAMQDMIDEDDLYQPEDDPSYGKESEPHVTVLYGLHSDNSDSDIEKEINKIKRPDIKFDGISSFSNPKFDVLKFDVLSKDMNKLNKKFREFPHTNDYPDYHPHCTIAYLKPNTAKKYIKKLKGFSDMDTDTSHVVYSKADGTKKSYKLS